MDISYSNIIEGCKRLSAYESKYAVDPQGMSMYPAARIVDADETLIKSYIQEGWKTLEARMSSVIDVVTNDGTEITFNTVTDSYYAKTTVAKSIEETLQSYAMMRWMEDKIPARSQAYANIFASMTANTIQIIHAKKAPETDD